MPLLIRKDVSSDCDIEPDGLENFTFYVSISTLREVSHVRYLFGTSKLDAGR